MATGKQRGGSRTLGRKLSNNTSGLNGIWFRWMEGQGPDPTIYLYVCSAWKDSRGKQRRTAYSVEANGRDGALALAIRARKKAGLPAPTLAEAIEAAGRIRIKGTTEMKAKSITVPVETVRAVASGHQTSVKVVVGFPAPRWARSAFRTSEDPREWWWANHLDPAYATRVEDPFTCPYGAAGDPVVVRDAHGSLKSKVLLASVNVERLREEGARSLIWHWVLQLARHEA